MRRVRVFDYIKRNVEKDKSKPEQWKTFKAQSGEGVFHCWGVDYEEFESGAGNFSTAIVERDDGVVKNIPVNMIEFINEVTNK